MKKEKQKYRERTKEHGNEQQLHAIEGIYSLHHLEANPNPNNEKRKKENTGRELKKEHGKEHRLHDIEGIYSHHSAIVGSH